MNTPKLYFQYLSFNLNVQEQSILESRPLNHNERTDYRFVTIDKWFAQKSIYLSLIFNQFSVTLTILLIGCYRRHLLMPLYYNINVSKQG